MQMIFKIWQYYLANKIKVWYALNELNSFRCSMNITGNMVKAIAAPATVSEYKFYNPLFERMGRVKWGWSTSQETYLKQEFNLRWEGDKLFVFRTFILAEGLGFFYALTQFVISHDFHAWQIDGRSNAPENQICESVFLRTNRFEFETAICPNPIAIGSNLKLYL